MLYISNRKENTKDLKNLHSQLFNWSANEEKINCFFDLCQKAYDFYPSERCKDKKCIIGPQCGNLDAEIMFIAEAPGRNGAERTGVPIYGDPSGDNFEFILNKATNGVLNRKDLYLTNTFLWNPTNNLGNNDKPNQKEINNSLPLLIRQIEIVNPKLIIALGRTAYETLGKIHQLPIQGSSLRSMAGNIYQWNNRYLGVMYHPSPRVVNTHRSLKEMIEDLRKMLKLYISRK